MKSLFVIYGLTALALAGGFLLRVRWSGQAPSTWSALGLWYLPFGTLINMLVILLMLRTPLGDFRSRANPTR